MEIQTRVKLAQNRGRFEKLERFLKVFLAVELISIVSIVLIMILFTVGFSDLTILVAFFLLLLFFAVNVVCGCAGIVLLILSRRKGYPGTGHIINWAVLIAYAWVFILLTTLILIPPNFID